VTPDAQSAGEFGDRDRILFVAAGASNPAAVNDENERDFKISLGKANGFSPYQA
jgi:hypothetical protein